MTRTRPVNADKLYDPGFVKGVFDRCSQRYIAFSYVCSFGFTERWRKQCVRALPPIADSRPIGYDLMAGTGEAWPHLLRTHPHIERVIAIDISSGMHKRAMDRLHRMRADKIEFIEDDILSSNLADESADFVVVTFGLKTFNKEQQSRLAGLMARVLKPGGVFSVIEASDPKGWFLRPLYIFHLTTVLPMVERLLLKGAQDFAMIGTYSARFGDASHFTQMLRNEGLEAHYRSYFYGCASGAFGTKPRAA